MNPQTPAEITTNIIAFIRAEGGLLSPLAEQLLRPALEQALEDAERRGIARAAEVCRVLVKDSVSIFGGADERILSLEEMAEAVEKLAAR